MEDLPDYATLYTSADEETASANRRGSERHMTLFRVGSLIVGDQRHLCLVKNVSSTGALIRVYCPIREGQPAILELKEQQPIAARVSWLNGMTPA